MTLFQSDSSKPTLFIDSDGDVLKKQIENPGGPRRHQSVDLKGTSMNMHRPTRPHAASAYPASAGQKITEQHTISPAAQIPPTKVLVIDEEPMAAAEMVATLTDAGFQCEIAGGPLEALDMVCADRTISIVVGAFNAPGRNNLDMISTLQDSRAAGPEIAVIAIAESGDNDQATEALRLGAMDCLFRPVAPAYLTHAMVRAAETLNSRRLERDYSERLARKFVERTMEERKFTDDLAQSNFHLQAQNQALSVSNRVKSEFLCLLDQELRTPLNAIIGFSEIIAANNEENGDEKELEFSQYICAAGGELLHIVNSIHEMTNASREDTDLARDEVDISEIVENTAEILASRAASASILLATNIEDDLPAVRGDARRLLRVICNVVDNAIRFSPPETMVRIDVEMVGHKLCVRVSDQGNGMTGDEIRDAGDAFRKVNCGTDRKAHGHGLGLALSRMYTEQHNGRLNIESSLGLGTTVTITIPVAMPVTVPVGMR